MNGPVLESVLEEGKAKIERLFQFVRAFTNSRHPIRRQLAEQPASNLQISLDELPMMSEWVQPWSGGEDARDWLLKVKLCPPDPCPRPPRLVESWLLPGWEKYADPARRVEEKTFRDADGNTQIETFQQSEARIEAWDLWAKDRTIWSEVQRRHDPVRALFERLQALRSELQKQDEQVELVLGVGLLKISIGMATYNHPILIKPLSLEFEPEANSFVITETDRSTDLYSELLADLKVDLSPAGNWRESIQRRHPLDSESLSILNSIKDWLRNQPGLTDISLSFSPTVFLRDRGGWASRAATDILEDLAKRAAIELPQYLFRLVGSATAERNEDEPEESKYSNANEDPEILFALPANVEQLQLARQLEKKEVVLVQGPPGTGKTHTIANLIGHLLSQGKRVLVTSHTSKALRVLREKVPKNIQSLCVSVLDDATQSRKELEESVQAIAERMQQGSGHQTRLVNNLLEDRAKLLATIQKLREDQRMCVRREYEPIVIGGSSIDPSKAAREVREGASKHAWIPGPLQLHELGVICPLTRSEISWLYRSQELVNMADEAQLRAGLPTEGWLPDNASWATLINDLRTAQALTTSSPNRIWPGCTASAATLEAIIAAANRARTDLSRFRDQGPWLLSLVEAGSDARITTEWQELREHVFKSTALNTKSRSHLLNEDPSLPTEMCTAENLEILKEICGHLNSGSGLGFFQRPWRVIVKGNWTPIIEAARCNGERPKALNSFIALEQFVELHLSRSTLKRRWQRQVVVLGGPQLPDDAPEKAAEDWLPFIFGAFSWFRDFWNPLVKMTVELGRPWSEVEANIAPQPTTNPRLTRAERLLDQFLLEWRALLAGHRVVAIKEVADGFVQRLEREVPSPPAQGVVSKLRQLIRATELQGFAEHSNELSRLRALMLDHKKRDQLLGKLSSVAEQWSGALRRRDPAHSSSLPQDHDSDLAWRWRQLNDELERRAHLDSEKISAELRQLTESLRILTGDLIASLCWARQLSVAERYRQHLMGWLDSMRRIGKGTGRHADKYRGEAREQLKQGQQAVPVWIMPMAEVFRSLTVNEGRFDVVIVDEASQAGIAGLLVAYLGHKVVVVGDHEQVSPDAVGDDSAVSATLQNQFIQGIPNTILYDGKLSLYDMSRWTASGMLSLSEHFRSVPAIIGFSNKLSYNGKIKPLREASSSLLKPVIPHRVPGVREGKSKLNTREAQEIVSLIGAMTESDAYRRNRKLSSIGVVSLLGDDQAKLIETLLRKYIPVKEIESRKIICGNAAQFQGDEREIMLLSMVDSNEGDGPMRMVGDGANELYKKRYNVAASRAQNQMWVIHSMDHATDLKPKDLRRELLEYAYESEHSRAAVVISGDAESEFERLVLKELVHRGYSVRAQYPVGYYRIDMVVESGGKKLAIECDGEKWHSSTEQISNDLARQAVLERLGWQFFRIRGSQFFRNPESAIQQLVDRLHQLGIAPASVDADSSDEKNKTHENLLRRAHELRTTWFSPQVAMEP